MTNEEKMEIESRIEGYKNTIEKIRLLLADPQVCHRCDLDIDCDRCELCMIQKMIG